MKTFVYVGTSLDGFIARKNGNIDWLANYESEEVFTSYKEFIGNIDAVVIGKGTFETVLTFPAWPYEKKVFVLSTSMKKVPERLEGEVRILSMKPREVLTYLAQEGFSNIYIDGGKVIQEFLKEDCIDEIILTRVPLLLGDGVPLFGSLDKDLHFTHRGTNLFSNGLVKSRYERRRS